MPAGPTSLGDRIAKLRLDAMQSVRSRSRREQIFLAVAGVIASLFVWNYAVWAPLQSAKKSAYEDLRHVESSRARLAALPTGAQLILSAERPLRQAITASAAAAGLAITRVESGSGGLEVEFESADFSRLVTWVDALHRQDGVVVASADISRLPSPGFVAATLTFSQ